MRGTNISIVSVVFDLDKKRNSIKHTFLYSLKSFFLKPLSLESEFDTKLLQESYNEFTKSRKHFPIIIISEQTVDK